MTRVHVIGASGYAGAEAVRLLARHPHFEIATVESSSAAGELLSDTFGFWRGGDRRFDDSGSAVQRLDRGDAVVFAGRGGEARAMLPQIFAADARAVDLSDDLRLNGRSAGAVYGFTERYRDAIAQARLVANPGCYPTCSLLALMPLAGCRDRIVQVILDAKSGITGAGRTPATTSLFAEVAETVRPYGLSGHRHEAEIAQELHASGIDAPLVFTPQVVPLRRGMLVSAYAIFDRAPAEADVAAAFERAYADNPFVTVLAAHRAPDIAAVAYSNDAQVAVSVHGNTVRVMCAIDNLGKGAAGQAIQNLNVMYGLDQEAGLHERSYAR